MGEEAPLFAAKDLEGNAVKLEDLRGKVVLLDFWATWCAPCLAELPNLEKLHEQFGDDGLVILGVSVDAEASAVERFLEQRKIPWRQIAAGDTESNPIARKYNVSAVPSTFLIDKNGKVAAKDLTGWRLQRKVSKLLNQKKEQATASR